VSVPDRDIQVDEMIDSKEPFASPAAESANGQEAGEQASLTADQPLGPLLGAGQLANREGASA
jgi:hypothetical protein